MLLCMHVFALQLQCSYNFIISRPNIAIENQTKYNAIDGRIEKQMGQGQFIKELNLIRKIMLLSENKTDKIPTFVAFYCEWVPSAMKCPLNFPWDTTKKLIN